jgi:hypothetical protein
MELLFWGIVKDVVCRENVQNINEMRDSIVRAAECVTKETPINREIYRAHKKLCELNFLKMYRLWLKDM